MRFLFFDIAFENLGVQVLTSILKEKGHEVIVLNKPVELNPLNFSADYPDIVKEAVDSISAYAPDTVGFSVFTHNYRLYREIAAQLKNRNTATIIIFGGIHTTLLRERILQDQFVDYAIYGEADDALPDLLEAIETNTPIDQVGNLCHRQNGRIIIQPCRPYIKDLDRIPFPDKSAYVEKNPFLGIRYHISASRGCLYNCTYCSNDNLHKLYGFETKHIRMRSPQHVIQELEQAVARYSCKVIYFVDEIFTYDIHWLKEFVPLYIEKINLPIDCITHPSFITEEKADLLQRIKTEVCTIGVQNADENLRKAVLNRNESNRRIASTISILRKRKIKVAVDHILGLPGETLESLLQSVRCYATWGASYVSMNWLAYYPGLTIANIARQHHILSNADLEKIALGEYVFNYEMLSAKTRTSYLKIKNLMNCVGILPATFLRFCTKHLRFVPSWPLVSFMTLVLSRFVMQRKSWAFAYVQMLLKAKWTNLIR